MARVVVVDDDEELIPLLEMILSDDGHEVHCASDGEAGMRLIERIRPDILLLDLHLPGLDGFCILTRVKATDWGKRIKVIMFCAEISSFEEFVSDKKVARSLWGVMRKPCALGALRNLIGKAAGEK